MRHIPATMATQHPDNARAPYWEPDQPFVSVHQERSEAVSCFKELDTGEYMWDWEGKHADAAVFDRLLSDYFEYFSQNQLGRDKFLTFRIPNIWEEKGYNLLQAMTVILSSEDFGRDLKLEGRPLFEVILPMTEKASQVLHMQKLFEKLAKFKSKEFTPSQPANNEYLELIPLVESVESQLAVDKLLTEYVRLHEQHFGRQPTYIRTFLACSDPALTSGFLATVLANKLALARLYAFSQQSGIEVYPIAGAGSLRFRGGLSPTSIDRFMAEFPGVRTVTIQSSFRYDHSLKNVKAAIASLEAKLPTLQALTLSQPSQRSLTKTISLSAGLYKQTLAAVVADLQPFFKAVPKRRDRRQHIGLLAYARSMGEQSLPRAITFTAGFYSIGVPPEFIGLGRALKQLTAKDLDLLKAEYRHLSSDLEAAGRFLNRDNLAILAKRNPAWQAIQTDITEAEQLLGLELQSQSSDEIEHAKLSRQALDTEEDSELKRLINEMAVLRKSIG